MSEKGIHVEGLVVHRGDRRVLDGLSFSVPPGSVYALLGGNGAGKSTALFSILGLLKPAGGAVRVDGEDPVCDADAVRSAVAYLPESVALYDHLSARENVRYFLDLAGQKRTRLDIEEAFASVSLDPGAWDKRLGAFSKGMRQKAAIALAVLRQTPILLLDEPTSGLDPAASADLHGLIARLKARGVAVLMVTHDLLGAAGAADAIGLIDRGRIDREWRDGAGNYDLGALHRAFSGQAVA